MSLAHARGELSSSTHIIKARFICNIKRHKMCVAKMTSAIIIKMKCKTEPVISLVEQQACGQSFFFQKRKQVGREEEVCLFV